MAPTSTPTTAVKTSRKTLKKGKKKLDKITSFTVDYETINDVDALKLMLKKSMEHVNILTTHVKEMTTRQLKDSKVTHTTPSRSYVPKILTEPKFPKTCVFDPSKKGNDSIVHFLSQFERLAAFVEKKYKRHHLMSRLSDEVQQFVLQHDTERESMTPAKAAMKYKGVKTFLLKSYKARGATEALFRELKEIKQGSGTMRAYFTKFNCKIDQLRESGRVIDDGTRRSMLLEGVRSDVIAEAMKMPEYYTMLESELRIRLIAFDESMKSSGAVNAASTTDIESRIAKGIENRVDIAVAKALAANGAKPAGGRGRDKKKRSTKFSQNTMRKLYSETQWAERMKCVESKSNPKDTPHLYDKDCYPVDSDGKKTKDSKPACVWCRGIGHTMLECTKFKGN